MNEKERLKFYLAMCINDYDALCGDIANKEQSIKYAEKSIKSAENYRDQKLVEIDELNEAIKSFDLVWFCNTGRYPV